jgi:copper(I)-binding protein
MTAPALAQSGSHQTGPMHSAAGPATYKVGGLTITAPWARATPRGAPVAGGYLTITNNGTGSDRLVGGSFAVADRFEVHEMTMEGGVMRMRPVAGGLEIKPGQTVELKPGGYHVMFMGLKGELKAGDTIRGTLEFARAGKIEISYPVRAMGGGSGHRSH